MARRLVPILLALAVMGAVTGIAGIMLVLLGQDWEDALFWILAAVMIGSALLVVILWRQFDNIVHAGDDVTHRSP